MVTKSKIFDPFLLYILHENVQLKNNLAKTFSTVCTDPFYGQTRGPRPPKLSQADPKLDMKSRLPKK
jgi:hypothetical protein